MTNRYGDIDISFRQLPPVYGYQSEQLVSIEESLKPIQSEINELSDYISIAKRHCHYPSEHGLSKDESAAVYIYTMEWGDTTLYRVLNRGLRSEDREVLRIWFPYLKLFNTALDKLPRVKESVWRGVPLDIGRHFLKDQRITWWSVNSCSSSIDVIKKFLGNNGNSTLFLIEAIQGIKISGYTAFENENEVILRMGTQFRVKSNPLIQQNGSHIVHLIENDFNNDDREPMGLIHSFFSRCDLIISLCINKILILLTWIKNSRYHRQVIVGIIAILILFIFPYLSSPNEPITKTICHINNNAKWKKDGITIAGGNGQGNGLNQLNKSFSVCIDDDYQCMYIADTYNHRVIEWKFGAKNGKIIAGENRQGNQIYYPTDVIINKKDSNSLIICDFGNRRVVQWSRLKYKYEKTLITDIDCYGLAMDNNGDFYISNYKKNEVRRWKLEKGKTNGIIVAGGNGEGGQLNQLHYPTYLVVDENYIVYVSDRDNHRVMKWMKGARKGSIVAGGVWTWLNPLRELNYPNGLIIDNLGNIYVSEWGNHRIIYWTEELIEGRIILGGNGSGNESNQFNYPVGLSFDRQCNLYVADQGNNRIQKFEIESN